MKICKHRIQRYQIFRDQVDRENDLYYKRLGWFVTAQGLLFTVEGLLLRVFYLENFEHKVQLAIFMIFLAFVSLYSCGVAHTKLTEARDALKWLGEEYGVRSPNDPLPHVSGAGGPKQHNENEFRSKHLPKLFASAWTVGLVLLISSMSNAAPFVVGAIIIALLAWLMIT